MRVQRRDNELNDALEALDDKFIAVKARCKTDIEAIPMAWRSLDQDELNFVDQELERCLRDRRYFIENYYVIRDESGILHTLYPWWTHQEMIYEVVEEEWGKYGCCRLIILKPRQAGSTTWNAALIFHATLFVPNSYSMAMAQDDRVSLEIFQRMMDAYHQLPWWMQAETLSKQQGMHVIFQRTDEQQRIVDPGLGSTLMISNAQKSTGVSIGRTIRNILASEVSRWPDSSVWTADIEPSLNAPDMLGIMESTAFGRNGLYYNMWMAAEKGESEWRALFIPVYRVTKYFLPVYKKENFTLTDNEKLLRASVKRNENFTIPLGFFKWRRRKIQACIAATGSDEEHAESYPLNPTEAFISSGSCAFPRKELRRQRAVHCRDPIAVGEIEYVGPDEMPILHVHPPTADELSEKPDRVNRLWIWEYPKEGGEYQIGCDQGGTGDDDDYTDAVVYSIGIDAGSQSVPDVQVAEWHGHINASHMAKVLAALGHWYNEAEIAVEYARDGITTGNELQWTLDYPQIYRWRRLDKIGNTLSLHTHWITNSLTREDAINRMAERLLDHQIEIRNQHAVQEMFDFGREEGVTKAVGLDNNDDMVLAHLIAIASANQSNRRQLRAESMSMGAGVSSSTAGEAMPKVPVVYAIYDQYGRHIQQVNSPEEGRRIIEECEKKFSLKLSDIWKIIPVVATKANTAYSPIFDGQGAERELYDHGMQPRDIRPDIVQQYRDLMNLQRKGIMDGEDD